MKQTIQYRTGGAAITYELPDPPEMPDKGTTEVSDDIIIRVGERLTWPDGSTYATCIRDIHRYAILSLDDWRFEGETPNKGDDSPTDILESEGGAVIRAKVNGAWRDIRAPRFDVTQWA